MWTPPLQNIPEECKIHLDMPCPISQPKADHQLGLDLPRLHPKTWYSWVSPKNADTYNRENLLLRQWSIFGWSSSISKHLAPRTQTFLAPLHLLYTFLGFRRPRHKPPVGLRKVFPIFAENLKCLSKQVSNWQTYLVRLGLSHMICPTLNLHLRTFQWFSCSTKTSVACSS